ncbi:hypothetical protein PAMP_010894 [Pampus punctatissimus]
MRPSAARSLLILHATVSGTRSKPAVYMSSNVFNVVSRNTVTVRKQAAVDRAAERQSAFIWTELNGRLAAVSIALAKALG